MDHRPTPDAHELTLVPVDSTSVELTATAVLGFLERVVRPIAIKPIGNDEFRRYFFGSAQVFHLGEHYLLVTASHCINEGSRQHNIGLSRTADFRHGEVHWLTGARKMGWCEEALLSNPTTGETKKATIDVAFIEITEAEARDNGFEPLELGQLAPRQLRGDEFTLIFGYPTFEYDVSGVDEGLVRARYLAFASVGVDEAEWPSKWMPLVNQVVRYPRHHIRRLEATGFVDRPLPPPKGISGSAIWSVPIVEGELFSYKHAQMVGIQYAHDERTEMLVGNNIIAILSLAADVFPETRALVEAAGFPLPGSTIQLAD